MRFDRDAFVAECRRAAASANPAAGCAAVVHEALAEVTDIDAAFESDAIGPLTLHVDERLTVQRVVWPPGVRSAPHDHRMWAVVGVYRGAEHNIFYERAEEGLRETAQSVVPTGGLIELDETVIHAVANPSAEVVCGLHVYGGDIDGVERSQWLPDGRELALPAARALYAELWSSVRSVAAELGLDGPDDRQQMYGAINAEVDRLRRLLTHDEVHAVLRRQR